MRKKIRLLLAPLFCFILMISGFIYTPDTLSAASSGETIIHFITIDDNNDAILIENRSPSGKRLFGMIDSGEDTDGPVNATNGTVTQGIGYEDQVVRYMRSAGVTTDNFVFYIGTHPHSDHIGSADTVIETFHPKRVYIQPYSDAFITNAANLWDNETVYNDMLAAADSVGATVIQTFNESAPVDPMTISIPGTITWEDGADVDGLRPDSLALELTKDGTVISSVTANAENGWNYSFTGLYKRNNDGSEINYNDGSYQIVQKGLPSSYLSSSEDNNIFQIINTHTVSDSSDSTISGSVTWDNIPADQIPLQSVEIQLQKRVVPDSSVTSDTNASVPSSSDSEWLSEGDPVILTQDSQWEFNIPVTVPENESTYEYQVILLTALPEGYQCSGGTRNEYNQYNLNIFSSAENQERTYETHTEAADSMLENAQSDNNLQVTPQKEDQVDPSSDLNLNGSYEEPSAAQMETYRSAAKAAADSLPSRYQGNPSFYLGDTLLEIVNYSTSYMRYPSPDANYFSLGVKITAANGRTAFLGGDINNFENPGDSEDHGYDETKLISSSKFSGGVDVLKLNHHGSYGSNTPTYLRTMNPKIIVLTGSFNHVANHTEGSDIMGGTFSTVRELVSRGTRLYATCWYSDTTGAIKINLNQVSPEDLPSQEHFAYSSWVGTGFWLDNGSYSSISGWKKYPSQGFSEYSVVTGSYFYFENSAIPSSSKWILDNGNWYYLGSNGTMQTGWILVDGKWYYTNASGAMLTGWQKIGSSWYYLNEQGVMLTGRQTIAGSTYYFFDEGRMASSQWIGSDYFNADGKLVSNYQNSNWKKDSNGWWYQHSDGSYPKNAWEKIDGFWYYFNSNGYLCTGWIQLGGKWYYLDPDGKMLTGWQLINGKWYYMSGSGEMVTGWLLLSGTWYYLGADGSMYSHGWHLINGSWYYMNTSGAMAANTWIGNYYVNASGVWIPNYSPNQWILSGNRWWYRHADGSYTTSNWELIDGSWYYFDSAGWMVTGWIQLDGSWYYCNPNGSMAGNGWHLINSNWYYMYPSGVMASSTWIGNYYVDASGAWISGYGQSQWILSGSRWWYRHSDGSYTASNWELIDGSWYYFDSAGWMVTGWIQLNGSWYYCNHNGSMAGSGWHLINGKWYYMYSSGVMAASTWIGNYYVDASGAWVI